MKLYNKKGLLRGLGATLLGVIFLIGDIFFFDKIEADIIWSILLIVIGLSDCLRCFSRKKADEDIISDEDERNKFVKLISKARSLDIVEVLCFITVAGATIALKQTGNTLYTGIVLTAGIGILLIITIKFITEVYYDKKK